MNTSVPRLVCALLPALMLLPPLHAQSVAPSRAEPSSSEASETVVLSPFTVTTEKDQGYKATNAISGTRMNTRIKDAPMPIEVITNEFMRDIGATSLREALQYSSGIILQSQNDALMQPNDSQVGSSGANNPEGVTGNRNNTTTKIRGFVVEQVLRDGFRRQFSTDWINIDRVEVVRGPEALLYGVGSFGGVVNFIPKRPERKPHTYASFSAGTQDFLRAEFDNTGPLGRNLPGKPAYRLTAAWQTNGNHTEYFKNRQFFISPVLSFRPFKNTEILIDNEFGKQREEGNGFQSIRSRIGTASQAVNRGASFITDGSVNARTFRWSGPDTYTETRANNHVVDVTQRITPNFFIRAGVNYNRVKREGRSIVETALVQNDFRTDDPFNYYPDFTVSLGGTSHPLRDAIASPPAGFTRAQVIAAMPRGGFRADRLQSGVQGLTLADVFAVQNNSTAVPPAPANNVTLRYKWNDREQVEDRLQYRIEGLYTREWYGKHSLLVGTQYQAVATENRAWGPARTYTNFNPPVSQQFSYKSPSDLGPFRFGRQGDGLRDPAMVPLDYSKLKGWDLGYYAAYQGRFWRDRITIIGGYRYDRSDARNRMFAQDSGVRTLDDRSAYQPEPPNEWSPQIGASFAINRSLSVFGLYSTGLIPNYNQLDGNGQAQPTKAKNHEVGVKFDFLDGRISGTVSAYKLKRINTPRFIWWAPAPYKEPQNPMVSGAKQATVWQFWGPENMWYAVNNTPNGLAIAKQILPSGFHGYLDRMAATPAQANNRFQPDTSNPAWGSWGQAGTPADNWNTGSQTNLFFQANQNTTSVDTPATLYWPLLDLTNQQHVAFASNAFNYMALANPGSQSGWSGNFYGFNNGQRLRFGDGTIGVQNAQTWTGANVPINDEAKGWDTQLILTPSDNLQVLLTYARVNRKITSQTYKYVKTPYHFPFAQYFYPVLNWGTINASTPQDAFGDVRDTSTFRVTIPEYNQTEDDTPRDQWAAWARYRLARFEALRGWTVGVGGQWQGRRQWYSGFNTDGTAITTNIDGKPTIVQFWTKPRFTLNGLVEYRTRLNQRYDARFALNLSNILDDQKKYGFIYAPGFAARFSSSIDF